MKNRRKIILKNIPLVNITPENITLRNIILVTMTKPSWACSWGCLV